MDQQDVKIKCKECGHTFIFTEKDQKFYEEQGFIPPKRCKKCRDAKKQRLKS